MDLAGREELLARVVAALAPIGAGARAVVIEGEAGIGKSSIWMAALERLAEGRRVLRTRLVEPDASLAFVGLHDLLDPVADEVLPHLSPPLAEALSVALRRREPGPEGIEAGSVAIAVTGALRALAASTPVLLALDDAQWLDGSSASVLTSAVRRLADADVAILVARRPVTGTPGLDIEAALEGTLRVEVPPLPLGALHHAIRTRLDVSLPRPALVRLHEVTRGNPFYALELARTWPRDEAMSAADVPLPAEMGGVLARRFDGLSPAARELAAAAAIDAYPTVPLLARVLDTHEAAVRAIVVEARAAGVLDERDGWLQFSHPLLAAAASGLAGEAERRALHARLAAATDDGTRRAVHLAASLVGPDAAVATALEEVAAEETARGATGQAAALLERAIVLTPPEDADDRARRQAAAAEALFIAGDVPRARTLLRAVLDGAPPEPVRLDAALTLATLTWFDGDSRDATALAETALATTQDPEWRGKYHSRLSWMYEHDLEAATAHARRAMELVDPEQAPARYAFALLNAAMGELQLGRSAHHDWVERGYHLQSQAKQLEVSTIPANWAKTFDRFDRARELAAEFRAQAERVGDDSSVTTWPIFLGELEAWAGHFDLALELVEEGLSLAQQTQQAAFVTAALARRAFVHTVRGELDAAKVDARRALVQADEQDSAPLIGLALGTLGLIALSEEDREGAVTVLDRAQAVLAATGDRMQPAHRFAADHIEALIGIGELERAEALLAIHEARGELGPRPWAQATALRCRALLQVARGDPEAGAASCEAALAVHETLENPFEHARTLLVLGRIRRRLRQRRAAAASLEAAMGLFERIGARRWAVIAHTEAERIGMQRADESELTPSEERIARLAASGLTNREVSARLYISPKTVEANLARVYGKLGIRSRAELGSVMGRGAEDGREPDR